MSESELLALALACQSKSTLAAKSFTHSCQRHIIQLKINYEWEFLSVGFISGRDSISALKKEVLNTTEILIYVFSSFSFSRGKNATRRYFMEILTVFLGVCILPK